MKSLRGRKFNRLTVLEPFRKNRFSQVQRLCRCDCGNELFVLDGNLRTGHTKSCGCLRKSVDGNSSKRIYRIWKGIKNRCESRNDSSYKDYGGRGIECKWDTYEEFKSDMYSSYLLHCKLFGKTNTTIDRINNDHGYRKGNCRWATPKEQANNRRSSRLIEFSGKILTVAQWSRKLGINNSTLSERLRRGWSIERTLTI